MKKTDVHHRKPQSLGGLTDSLNTIRVNKKQHMAWHILFQNRDPEEIALFINTIWLDPSYEFVCVKKTT